MTDLAGTREASFAVLKLVIEKVMLGTCWIHGGTPNGLPPDSMLAGPARTRRTRRLKDQVRRTKTAGTRELV
jgi:hypothetical protein